MNRWRVAMMLTYQSLLDTQNLTYRNLLSGRTIWTNYMTNL